MELWDCNSTMTWWKGAGKYRASPLHHGRHPPPKHKLKTCEEAKQRWLNDNRQFAPWQYADHAMMYRGGEPEVIPPHIKEQLHNFSRGWTKVEGVAHRSRHRMIANSWHMSVAIVILAMALQVTQARACPLPQQLGRGSTPDTAGHRERPAAGDVDQQSSSSATMPGYVGTLAHVPQLTSPGEDTSASRAGAGGHISRLQRAAVEEVRESTSLRL